MRPSLCFVFIVFFNAHRYSLARDPNFKFASYYGDHMVLQQGPKRANLWGYGSNLDEQVSIHLDNQPVITTTVVAGHFESYGVWSAMLPPMPPGGPHVITAVLENDTKVTLQDVLFGDVWVCSGQSNMEFDLRYALNASNEFVDAHKYQDIRIFAASHSRSSTPLYDFTSLHEQWSLPQNNSLGVDQPQFSYFSAVCWLYGKYLYQKLGYPIGLMESSWGGTPVEAWSDVKSLAQCGIKPPFKNESHDPYPSTPAVLWNAMIHPLLNNTIYGAIWYQGEADAVDPIQINRYNCTFPAMIDGWREMFHNGSNGETSDNFPFGFVQLAPWRNISNVVGFPDIRWHQTADKGFVPNDRMPNVFMAVAMDLPDFTSPFSGIHPRDKQDVAHRLVLSGMAIAYNFTRQRYAGPFPTEYIVFVAANTVQITYDEDSLDVRNKDGFEICCLDESGKGNCTMTSTSWYPAPITDHDGTSVTLSYGSVCGSSIVSIIRYEWRESPCPFKGCAVYESLQNLPAPPFIENLLNTGRKTVKAVTNTESLLMTGFANYQTLYTSTLKAQLELKMLQRRRSSRVTAEAHESFVNRSRQLIRVTRDQIVKLNDMSTEVREMTEQLFSEKQSFTNRSSRRSSVGVRFESHHMTSKRRSSKTISMKLPTKKQSQSTPRKSRLLMTKDAKDGTENSEANILEVNGTSSIEAAKAGFVGLEKQVNDTTQRSKRSKESENNETKGRNFFGYNSTDKARYILNENGSAQQRKNAAAFEYKFRSQRPTLQLPQITLSTDELSPLLTATAMSTPRSESPNTSRVDAWNSRALIMFGNNYDKFIRNRTESIPFRCAAFNRQQKLWY